MTIKEQIAAAKQQDLLTVEQFALLTQYAPKSIYRLIARKKIAVVRIGPRTIRIPLSAARVVRDQHPDADQTLSI